MLSAGTISRTGRRGLRRLSRVWQHTSAGGVLFPVVYHRRDPVRWSAPVDRVASRSAHIVVGAGHGRLSSTWLKYLGPGPGEGASLKGGTCAPVPAQPQGRQGRADRKGGTSRTEAKRAGECHGLTGLPEAIEATWPQATVQTCVVHPVPRPWMRFVSYRGEPEGRDRSQGRSAPPRTSRPPGRL